MAAWVGLDWADKKHSLVVRNSQGVVTKACELEQKPHLLDQFFLELRQHYPQGLIAVCLEQSRGPVLYTLLKYDFVMIYPVNPRCLSDFRGVFKVSGAKGDPTDADLLSDLGYKHADRLRPFVPEESVTRHLRFLVETRRDFVQKRTGLSNELTATLKSYYPVALEIVGENLERPMGLEFLRRWPNMARLKAAKPGVLRAFFYAHNSRCSYKPCAWCDNWLWFKKRSMNMMRKLLWSSNSTAKNGYLNRCREPERLWLRVWPQPLARSAATSPAPPISCVGPESLPSKEKAGNNAPCTFVLHGQSSCIRPWSNLPNVPLANATGHGSFTRTSSRKAKGVTPPFVWWLSNGYASFGAAGPIGSPMTKPHTSAASSFAASSSMNPSTQTSR